VPDEPEAPRREQVERIQSVGSDEVVEHRSPAPPEHEAIDIGLRRQEMGYLDLPANPTSNIADIRPRRFDIIEREQSEGGLRLGDEAQQFWLGRQSDEPNLHLEGAQTLQLGGPQPGENRIMSGGDLIIRAGSGTEGDVGEVAFGTGGQLQYADGPFLPPEPEHGSLEWWQTKVNLTGAVFHFRRKITTLPQARSSLLSVLEARAKTAPPTWGELIMADDDED
jgi:hypothetical protein